MTLASSCGRIGYDEIIEMSAPAPGAPGGSGAAVGDSAPSTGGFAGDSGGSGNGGAYAGNGGAGGSGGIVGRDATVASGGAIGTGGTDGGGGGTATGGTDGGGGVGCADGQREGFLDTATYPDIAACAGGFAIAGTVDLAGPACARRAGDDGLLPDGQGCNVEDLCAVGFHVCVSAVEVGAKSLTGCTDAAQGTPSVFYLTLQSGGGQQKCGAGTNDVFGCGTMGFRPSSGCPPLNAASGDLCAALIPPWSCGSDLTNEALNIVKPDPAAGGVLCCRD